MVFKYGWVGRNDIEKGYIDIVLLANSQTIQILKNYIAFWDTIFQTNIFNCMFDYKISCSQSIENLNFQVKYHGIRVKIIKTPF